MASLNTFVCWLCRQDVNKVLSDKLYVPRWRKGSKLSTCCVMDCTGDVFATLHKASSDQIQAAFEAGELRSSESRIPVPTPLCKHHYQQVYNYRPCACVGVVRILYLKVYDFPHTRRHFVGQWNSSNVHVDPFLAPYQQY